MRSGRVDIGNGGRLWYVSTYGYYWSRTSSSKYGNGIVTPSAYYLTLGIKSVGSSDGPYARWLGNPPPLPSQRRGKPYLRSPGPYDE